MTHETIQSLSDQTIPWSEPTSSFLLKHTKKILLDYLNFKPLKNLMMHTLDNEERKSNDKQNFLSMTYARLIKIYISPP